MGSLYVIGNGFDLAHGLPTSYRNDFVPIVIEECEIQSNDELFNKLNRLYFGNRVENWSQFEERIGKPGVKVIKDLQSSGRDNANEFEDLASDDGYDTTADRDYEMGLFDKADELQRASKFDDMQLIPDENPGEIKAILSECMERMVEAADQMMEPNNPQKRIRQIGKFEQPASFITFNYTDTLENVYDIPQQDILHIHGCLSQHQELIWGNDKDSVDVDPDVIAKEIDTEGIPIDYEALASMDSDDYLAENEYTNGKMAVEIAKQEGANALIQSAEKIGRKLGSYGHVMIKPIQTTALSVFLANTDQTVGSISTIYVLGHSLGQIDSGYFQLIDEKFPNATWKISYFPENEAEKKGTCKKANDIGLNVNDDNMYKFSELFSL